MCQTCDEPASRRDARLPVLRRCITARGWAVEAVERDRAHPPWAYTAGLSTRGLPELVVTGLPVLEAGRLADDMAAHVVRCCVPVAGQRFTVRGRLLRIVPVFCPWAHLRLTARLYGEKFQAVQLVHADARGRWPWEADYDGMVGGQPVLGPAA